MRVLPWLLAGAAIGAGVAVLVLNDWESEYDTDDRAEDAARKTFGWGTRQRAQGKVGAAFGRFKEGVGELTGDSDLEIEGAAEKAVGNVRDKAGKLGHAVAQTVHDLNN